MILDKLIFLRPLQGSNKIFFCNAQQDFSISRAIVWFTTEEAWEARGRHYYDIAPTLEKLLHRLWKKRKIIAVIIDNGKVMAAPEI
jgi:hypothetical protein